MSIKSVLVLAGLFVVCFAGMFALRQFVLTPPAEPTETAQEAPAGADRFLAALGQAGAPAGLGSDPSGQRMKSLVRELRTARQDVRVERRTVEQDQARLRAARNELEQRIGALEEQQAELQVLLVQVRQAKEALAAARIRIDADEEEQVKHQAAIFEKMEAEAAALHLAHMAEGGQDDQAVKILHYMRERAAAAVLAGMSEELVARLCERMRRIQTEKGS